MLVTATRRCVKTAHILVPAEAPLGDRRNTVHMGTVVTGGDGVAIVTTTGTQTEASASVERLTAVRTSRDFSAAYNPLLSMAYRLSQVDPTMAGALLRDLEIANPARPEAREMRRRLAPR